MAKGTGQKLKLLYVSKIMQKYTDEEHGLTIQELTQKLEKEGVKAERKSLYEDLRDLDKFDLVIDGEKDGKSYRYKIVDRPFAIAELKLLVDAIGSSKIISEKKSKKLIEKLGELTSIYEAKKLERQVYVTNRGKTANEDVYFSIDNIHTAMGENKRITFQYVQWNIKKELVPRHDGAFYDVSPWGLVWDDENYYLVGFDSNSQKIKHYRVDKMIRLTILDEAREGKEAFEKLNFAEYTQMNFGMFGGREEVVKIQFPDDKVGILLDRFGTDISIVSKHDNTSVARVKVCLSNQFYGWLFGLGGDFVLTGPDEAVEEMTALLEKWRGNL